MWFRIAMLTSNGAIRSAAGWASSLNSPQRGFSLFMISGNAGAQRKET